MQTMTVRIDRQSSTFVSFIGVCSADYNLISTPGFVFFRFVPLVLFVIFCPSLWFGYVGNYVNFVLLRVVCPCLLGISILLLCCADIYQE